MRDVIALHDCGGKFVEADEIRAKKVEQDVAPAFTWTRFGLVYKANSIK